MNINRSKEKRQAVRVNKNSNNTIEIKGQLYNASSGASVQPAAPILSATKIPVKEISQSVTLKPSTKARRAHVAHNIQPHAPSTAQILMRSSVKKPKASLKRHLKISESTDKTLAQMSPIPGASSLSLAAPHLKRRQQAAVHTQSEHISHFVTPKPTVVMPLRPPLESWQPEPRNIPVPPEHTPATFLEEAFSHSVQPPVKSLKARWRRTALISFAVPVVVVALLIIGDRSFTSLQLRVASAKAGFHTSLPAYHPAGYSLGQLSYNQGIFASEFHSKSSTQTYTITQQSTPWNTQQLLSNYLHLTTANYQTVTLGNRTIYIYGNGNATWVSKGIWYQLDSDGSLNESQIIDIVNSL